LCVDIGEESFVNDLIADRSWAAKAGPITSAAQALTGRSSSTVTVPPLYCPDPVRVDERLGAEVNDLLTAWVEQVGTFPGRLDHVRACDYGRYAMLIHPDTDDPQRLLLAA
jgi:2-methylisoborneol synthase